MSGLPNHLSYLTPFDPRAPSWKTPRANIGPYPGSVPYLTDSYINNDNVVNKVPGQRTNGSVRTSVVTRTRDQNSINVNQLAFMDTQVTDRPIFWSLQRLNAWLADSSDQRGRVGGYTLLKRESTIKPFMNRANSNGKIANREEAERLYIMNRFRLYGAIANRDTDVMEDMPRERIARGFTVTVKGVCHILDYWSRKNKILQPYDQCYFVLKKVKLEKGTMFQYDLTNPTRDSGIPISSDVEDKYVWQIVPFHTSDNVINVSEYTWEEERAVPGQGQQQQQQMEKLKFIGGYWKCGNAHEYVDTGYKGLYDTRDEYTVSRNITMLHMVGRSIPIHFYLRMDNGIN